MIQIAEAGRIDRGTREEGRWKSRKVFCVMTEQGGIWVSVSLEGVGAIARNLGDDVRATETVR